jgi:hypothetical protein
VTVYERITWVPDVLRRAGLQVVEVDGWRARGLSETRTFDPRFLVWHHDASSPGDSPGVPAFMVRNYETAGAQLWVDRAGRWHIIASGRAAHAGTVLPGMPTNETSIGVETDHTTGEAWPDVQLVSLRVGTAAILSVLGVGAIGLHFHKTICSPPGRKVDPAGLNLDDERRAVARLITPGGDVALTDDDARKVARAVLDLMYGDRSPGFRNQVRLALDEELGDESGQGAFSDRLAAKVSAVVGKGIAAEVVTSIRAWFTRP